MGEYDDVGYDHDDAEDAAYIAGYYRDMPTRKNRMYGFLDPDPKLFKKEPTTSPSYDNAVLMAEAFGASYPKLKEYAEMKQNEDILAEAQKLRDQAEELERRVAQREKYGADPFKNGEILKVEMKYRGTRITYTYAVVKTAGRFWLTGKLMGREAIESGSPVTSGWTWDHFVAWLAQADASVWRAERLSKVL